jgi:hypothetical protein
LELVILCRGVDCTGHGNWIGFRSGMGAGDDALHEFISELMKASLAAEVPGAGAQTGSSIPSAHAQLAALLRGYKPMVGLPLFCPADIARNCLPDHSFSFASRSSREAISTVHRVAVDCASERDTDLRLVPNEECSGEWVRNWAATYSPP